MIYQIFSSVNDVRLGYEIGVAVAGARQLFVFHAAYHAGNGVIFSVNVRQPKNNDLPAELF